MTLGKMRDELFPDEMVRIAKEDGVEDAIDVQKKMTEANEKEKKESHATVREFNNAASELFREFEDNGKGETASLVLGELKAMLFPKETHPLIRKVRMDRRVIEYAIRHADEKEE